MERQGKRGHGESKTKRGSEGNIISKIKLVAIMLNGEVLRPNTKKIRKKIKYSTIVGAVKIIKIDVVQQNVLTVYLKTTIMMHYLIQFLKNVFSCKF